MRNHTNEEQAVLMRAARARVKLALRQIDEAQASLCAATATLASLQWAAPEWKATYKLADRVKQHWRKARAGLEYSKRSEKIRLDPMATEAVLSAHAAAKAGQGLAPQVSQ